MSETDAPPTPAEGQHRGRKLGRFQRGNRFHKREVDKAAEAMAEKHDLPQPPGKDLKFDQVLQYLSLLTPEMWTHVAVYTYRLHPRIIRQIKDPKANNYIDCLSQPFTLDYFINNHGGGKYLLQATDSELRGPASQLFRCIFEIDMNQHQPKLIYEELDINHRDNMSYIQMLQSKGVLNDKGQPVTPNPPTPAGNTGLNTEVIKEILSLVRTLTSDQQENLRNKLGGNDPLTKSIGDILLERMKQDDPMKLVALIASLKEKPANDIPIAQILQMMAEQNKASMQSAAEQRRIDLEYTKAMLETQRKQEPTGDSPQFAQFREMFAFARDVMDLGRGGGGQRNGWDIGLDYVREAAPLLQQFLAARNGVPVPPGAPGKAAGAFDPYRDTAALRQHATQINQTTGPGAQASQDLMLLQQFAPLLVNALNNGTPGYDFADYLTGLMGTATHAMIAAQGEDTLVSTALTIPPLAVFGETRLRTFAHEFIHFEEMLKQNAAEEAVN